MKRLYNIARNFGSIELSVIVRRNALTGTCFPYNKNKSSFLLHHFSFIRISMLSVDSVGGGHRGCHCRLQLNQRLSISRHKYQSLSSRLDHTMLIVYSSMAQLPSIIISVVSVLFILLSVQSCRLSLFFIYYNKKKTIIIFMLHICNMLFFHHSYFTH